MREKKGDSLSSLHDNHRDRTTQHSNTGKERRLTVNIINIAVNFTVRSLVSFMYRLTVTVRKKESRHVPEEQLIPLNAPNNNGCTPETY